MKQIKFDLPIDGTKVRNIEELRDHFSTEILDLYKNGLLVKWLINQRHPDYAQAVERLLPTETDANLLKLLCGIFEIEVDFEIIQQLADYHGNGIKIESEQLQYKQKHDELSSINKNKRKRGDYWFGNEYVNSAINIKKIEKTHKAITGEDIVVEPLLLRIADISSYMNSSYYIIDTWDAILNKIPENTEFLKKVGDEVICHELYGKKNSDEFIKFNISYEMGSYNHDRITKRHLSASCFMDCYDYGVLYKKVYNFFNSFQKKEINGMEFFESIVAYVRIDV